MGTRVARLWPQDAFIHNRIENVHAWLGHLKHLAFVPLPCLTRDGATFVERDGRYFQVEPWKQGAARRLDPKDEDVIQAFEALARVHQALRGFQRVGPSPGLLRRQADLRSLGVTLSQLRDEVRAAVPSVERDLALRCLERIEARAQQVSGQFKPIPGAELLQPCLRDCHAGHFLFDGDRLTGLIDFGAMDVDSVAADLARLLSTWRLGAALRQAAFDAYARVGSIDAPTLKSVALFEQAATLFRPLRWIQWHFAERRRFEDAAAVREMLRSGLEELQRCEPSRRLALTDSGG